MCLIVLERHSGVVAVELNKLSGHYGQLYILVESGSVSLLMFSSLKESDLCFTGASEEIYL